MFGPLSKKPARLGQWNGRRRSSRSDRLPLPGLLQRPVLLRLLVVLVTAVVATALPYLWGPALPYRVGEVLSHDVRVRVFFEVVNEPQTERAREAAVERLPAASRDDPAACEAARQSVAAVVEKYPVSTPLVQRGVPITESQLALLEEEQRAFQDNLEDHAHILRGLALFLVMGLLATLVVLYVVRFQPGLAQSLPKIVGVCALVALTLALGLVLSEPPWYAVLVPLTTTTAPIGANPGSAAPAARPTSPASWRSCPAIFTASRTKACGFTSTPRAAPPSRRRGAPSVKSVRHRRWPQG